MAVFALSTFLVQVRFLIDHIATRFAVSWVGKGTYYDNLLAILKPWIRDVDLFPCLEPRLNLILEKDGDFEIATRREWDTIMAHKSEPQVEERSSEAEQEAVGVASSTMPDVDLEPVEPPTEPVDCLKESSTDDDDEESSLCEAEQARRDQEEALLQSEDSCTEGYVRLPFKADPPVL